MNKAFQTPYFSAVLLSTSPSPYQTFSALFLTFLNSVFLRPSQTAPILLASAPIWHKTVRRILQGSGETSGRWLQKRHQSPNSYASARARTLSLGFVFPFQISVLPIGWLFTRSAILPRPRLLFVYGGVPQVLTTYDTLCCSAAPVRDLRLRQLVGACRVKHEPHASTLAFSR